MSAETDPKLVEEIDAIPTDVIVDEEAAEALAARKGKSNSGNGTGAGGAVPQGGPYQTHGEPGGGDDPNGGPYQPHSPEPGKPGPVVPTGGPYQTHSVDEPISAQN